MKLLAMTDIHSHTANISRLRDWLQAVDVVLLAGDLTNGRLKDAQTLIETLRQYNSRIYAVPGNMDNVEILRYLQAEGCSIHRSYVTVDDVVIAGMGGALPFFGKFVYNDDQFATMLTELAAQLPAMPQVFVCHQPPYHTALDRIRLGRHVGSKAVRAYIEQHQPLVCFTGHIHEAIGVDTIGQTQIVNPGRLGSGGVAYAEIAEGRLVDLEIRRIDK